MKSMKQILVLVVVAVTLMSQTTFAQLHLDTDTGKMIKDGFDIELFAELPSGHASHFLSFGKGGSFGTDLYVTASGGSVYRINPSGQASLFATLPTTPSGIAFPDSDSGFGDYAFVGSGDGYYHGNRNIYKVDGSGNATVFVNGSTFLGGTINPIEFSPVGSPYGDYLYTQDDNPNQIYQVASDTTVSGFSSGIHLAIDFMFDTYGQFDNQLIVVNTEKSEHGSHYNTLYKVAPDGTKTTLLNDVFHMGGGDITDPSSPFEGKLFVTENYWPSQPTDIYAIDPDGSHELFARNFRFGDYCDIAYGPDGALYISGSGHIYKIAPDLIDASIDIRPGNDNNPINLKSNGILPVAIFGDEEFDVYDIDLSSLSLDGALPKQKGKSGKVGVFKDVNDDGLTDLLLHFELGGLDVAGDASELILEGLLNDGMAFTGSDAIRLVGPGDFNGDGAVDGVDFGLWQAGAGDADGDGDVDGVDFGIWQANYGTTAEAGATAIPEPATLGFLIIGGLALLIRKHK